MIRTTLALALVSLAAAQPALDVGPNGGLRVTRQVSTSLSDIDVRIADAVGDARVAAGEAAHSATRAATSDMSAQMFTMQTTLTDQMTAVNALLASQSASISSQMSTAISTQNVAAAAADARGVALEASLTAGLETATQSIATAMDSTAAALTTSIGSVSDSVAVSISRTRTAVDAQITNALAGVASSITAVNRNVTLTLAGKADADIHMWTGGCASHGHSGWQEYCLNQAHINTAAPKFRKQTNTRFQALVAGYYAINYWVTYLACGWQYQLIYVANTHRVHGHQRQGYHEGGHSWRDSHAYLQWPVTAGQQFWGRSYSGCWRTWHSTNTGGAHSRITAVYSGSIAA